MAIDINVKGGSYAGDSANAVWRKNAAPGKKCALAVTDLTSPILSKNQHETMVIVRHQPEDDGFIDGHSLAEWGQRSFRVEVTIVDETCSKQQKAQYQREVFNTMSALIGNVPPHANVHVIDCKAASCGHGVIAREYRFQHQDEFYR